MRQILSCAAASLLLSASLVSGGTEWSMEGEAVTADNCVVGCPCLFGEKPTHGHCEFFGIMQVRSGHYGDVDLSGARFELNGTTVD